MGWQPHFPKNPWVTGARIRLHSYIGNEYILGLAPYNNVFTAILMHLSTDDNPQTIFNVIAADKDWEEMGRNKCFRLQWAHDPQWYLGWDFPYKPVRTWGVASTIAPDWPNKNISPPSDVTLFRPDLVRSTDGIAMNDHWKGHVLDLAGGLTERNTMIYSWPWNGGDNQVWRVEVMP